MRRVAIIGGGAIGMTLAREFALHGDQVTLFERHAELARENTSHNSQVLHSGLYYTPGTLKARLSVAGHDSFVAYCQSRSIPHRRTGKLLLALDQADCDAFPQIRALARANGLGELTELTRRELQHRVPQLEAIAALFTDRTAVVDVASWTRSLQRELRELAVDIQLGHEVQNAVVTGSTVRLATPDEFTFDLVINAAGLGAIALAGRVFPRRSLPQLELSKGTHFVLPEATLPHVLYPGLLPGSKRETITAVPLIGGGIQFGPAMDEQAGDINFAPPAAARDRVGRLIRRYLPALDETQLLQGVTGVRPRLASTGPSDWRFEWAPDGAPWLDLWGLESPALTAAFAIATHVRELVVR